MSNAISPIGNDQFFDVNGNLLVGGQLFTYLAGTTTKAVTYTNISGGGSHTNPIILNASGLPPSPIYIPGGIGYKFVIAGPGDTDPPSSPIYTWDDVQIFDASSFILQQWVAGTTPTYISGSSFSVAGDQTATYTIGRRLKMVTTISTYYGVITASVFGAVTTITVVLDSGALDASLNALFFSVLTGQNTAVPNMRHSGNNTTVVGDFTSIGDVIVAGQDIKADDGASASTFLQFWVRVSSTLRAAYKLISSTAFNAIFSHGNSADRTYSLPNASCFLTDLLRGPSSIGAGSTISHEGTVTISSNQALSGIHFYTSFTLNAGITATVADNNDRLIIVASDTITINGTIDAIGAGSSAGAGGGFGSNGGAGSAGFTQPSGSGGGAGGGGGQPGAGAGVYVHGVLRAGAGSTSVNGTFLSIASVYSILGGSGGGGGAGGNTGGGNGGAGGKGGGSIILIAPNVILGGSSVLNTSGENGSAAQGGSNAGGGGGGGAGNIYMFCRTYTNNGCTFTQSGGTGGAKDNNGAVGGAGAAGVKLILIYD